MQKHTYDHSSCSKQWATQFVPSCTMTNATVFIVYLKELREIGTYFVVLDLLSINSAFQCFFGMMQRNIDIDVYTRRRKTRLSFDEHTEFRADRIWVCKWELRWLPQTKSIPQFCAPISNLNQSLLNLLRHANVHWRWNQVTQVTLQLQMGCNAELSLAPPALSHGARRYATPKF